jgi:hypothetical protein
MRPLSEKTPHDRIAGLGYGVRQLERRPAPVAAAAAPGDCGSASYAELRLSADWTNPSNGNNAVMWTTTTHDNDGYVDAADKDHFLLPEDGVYSISFFGTLQSLGTNPVAVIFEGEVDGSPSRAIASDAVNPNSFQFEVSTTVYLTKEVSPGVPRAVWAALGKAGGTQILDANWEEGPYFSITKQAGCIAPGGPAAAEIPWARIYSLGAAFGGSDQTIANNTVTRINTDLSINSYTTYFTARTVQDDIQILQKGYYSVRISVMNSTFADTHKLKFIIDGIGVTHHHIQEVLTDPVGVNGLGALWMVQMDANDTVQPWIFHKTGASRNIASRMCEVAYLGTFTPAAVSGSGVLV